MTDSQLDPESQARLLAAVNAAPDPGEPASAEPCGPDGCAHPDQHAPCPAATPDGPDRWSIPETSYRSTELLGEEGKEGADR